MSNNSTIDLEILRQKYSNLLIQYKSAVADYVNYLQSNSNINKQQLVTIKGQAFNGTGSAGQSSATTLRNCVASCSNSKKCTGATFNPVKRHCWTRTGDANITAGIDTDYALIPAQKAALSVLKSLCKNPVLM